MYKHCNFIMLHNKDVMHSVFLCIAILTSTPSVIAIDKLSSIAGPIFRTQPAPSRSNGHTTVTKTVLVPQPALWYPDEQTTVTETVDGDVITNPPQQQLQSTQSLDDANLPKIPLSSLNKTAADTDLYAQ